MSTFPAFGIHGSGAAAGGRPAQEPLSSLYHRSIQSSRPWASELEHQDKSLSGLLGGGLQQHQRQQQPAQQGAQQRQQEKRAQSQPHFGLPGQQNPMRPAAGGAPAPSAIVSGGAPAPGASHGGLGRLPREEPQGQQELRDQPHAPLQPTLCDRLFRGQRAQQQQQPPAQQPSLLRQQSHPAMQALPQQQQPQQQPPQQQQQKAPPQQQKAQNPLQPPQQQHQTESASAKLDRLVKQGAEKNRLRKIATPQVPQAQPRNVAPGLRGGAESARASDPIEPVESEPKHAKGADSRQGPPRKSRRGAGNDSDDSSAEAMQCDPPPKSLQTGPQAQAQGGVQVSSLSMPVPPSKGLQAQGSRRRGLGQPEVAEAPAQQAAQQPAEFVGEKSTLLGGGASRGPKVAAAPQRSLPERPPAAAPAAAAPLPKRQRTDNPPSIRPSAESSAERPPSAAAREPPASFGSDGDAVTSFGGSDGDAAEEKVAEEKAPASFGTGGDLATGFGGSEEDAAEEEEAAEEKASGGSGSFVCEVLDARPERPLDFGLLEQMAAKRQRTRSPSAGSELSQAASPHPPSPVVAPPSPTTVAAAARGGLAAALKGVAAELRAMEEVEEARALLQQMSQLGLITEGFEGTAEDQRRSLAAISRERLPRWLADLDRLERRLGRECQANRDLEKQGRPEEVLRLCRQAGSAFSRAIQQVMEGTPSGAAAMEGALTLEEELAEFAHDAAEGRCGLAGAGTVHGQGVSAGEAAQAAADLWEAFGDVRGYAAYLEKNIHVAGADVPLSGGAAWHRLMAELEVAMRLVHLKPEQLEGLDGMALQLQGARVLGGQGWEDMAQKLMHCLALGPLQRRARYVVTRVAWALRRQKVAAGAWLRTMGKGSVGWLYSSSSVPQHWQLLESNPQVRDLVYGAVDSAAAAATAPLLAFFEAAICSGCQSPQLLLRPRTQCELQLFASGACETTPKTSDEAEDVEQPSVARSAETEEEQCAEGVEPVSSARSPEAEARPSPESIEAKKDSEGLEQGSGTRSRVLAEIRGRFAAAPRLPADGPSVPGEADVRLRAVLGRSFRVLRSALVGHVLSFAGTALAAFTNRGLDEAIGAMGLQPRDRRALESGHRRVEAVASRAEERLAAVQRWNRLLRDARPLGF